MPISFPQYVKIQNARLQVLSTVLHAIIFAIVTAQFIIYRQYSRELPIDGSVNLQQTVPIDTAQLVAISESQVSQPICNDTSTFNYWYNDAGTVRFENHSCLPMCQPFRTSPRCLHAEELLIKESPQRILAVTQVQESVHAGQLTEATFSNYFVPSTLALNVSLAFTYEVPSLQWWQGASSELTVTRHGSRYDTSTIILDSAGHKFKIIPHGKDISLSLTEILELAEVESLNRFEPMAGSNHMPGSADNGKTGPAIRLSGFDIDLVADCDWKHQSSSWLQQDGRICTFKAKAKFGKWTTVDCRTKYKCENCSHTCRGIRIQARVKGQALSLNLNSIFINAAAAAVFFQVPKVVVIVVGLWLCGHVSDIYRHVVYRKFSITAEAAAMSMRLLEHEVAFNDLEALDDSGSRSGVIDKDVIAHSIAHLMSRRSQTLDNLEMQQMIDFCINTVNSSFKADQPPKESGFHAILQDVFESVTTIVSDLKETFGYFAEDEIYDVSVDVDKFASACSTVEPINFDALVKLFDKDRRRSLMESFFMPVRLKSSLKRARRVDSYNIELAKKHSTKSHIHAATKTFEKSVANMAKVENEIADSIAKMNVLWQTMENIQERTNQMHETFMQNDLRHDKDMEQLKERVAELEGACPEKSQQLRKTSDSERSSERTKDCASSPPFQGRGQQAEQTEDVKVQKKEQHIEQTDVLQEKVSEVDQSPQTQEGTNCQPRASCLPTVPAEDERTSAVVSHRPRKLLRVADKLLESSILSRLSNLEKELHEMKLKHLQLTMIVDSKADVDGMLDTARAQGSANIGNYNGDEYDEWAAEQHECLSPNSFTRVMSRQSNVSHV